MASDRPSPTNSFFPIYNVYLNCLAIQEIILERIRESQAILTCVGIIGLINGSPHITDVSIDTLSIVTLFLLPRLFHVSSSFRSLGLW